MFGPGMRSCTYRLILLILWIDMGCVLQTILPNSPHRSWAHRTHNRAGCKQQFGHTESVGRQLVGKNISKYNLFFTIVNRKSRLVGQLADHSRPAGLAWPKPVQFATNSFVLFFFFFKFHTWEVFSQFHFPSIHRNDSLETYNYILLEQMQSTISAPLPQWI